MLIARDQPVTPDIAARIALVEARSSPRAGVAQAAGLLILASLLAFFLFRYSTYHQRSFKRVKHLHAMLVSILLSMLLVSQAVVWIAEQVSHRFRSPFNDPKSYVYLVPIGAGAILVTLLANGRIAMVYAAIAAFLFGAQNGWELPVALWALLVQWAGVYAITSYRERSALLRAGLVVGGAGVLVALAVEAIAHAHEPWPHSLFGAALAFVGGLGRGSHRVVRPSAARRGVPRPHRHPVARAVQREQPAPVAARRQGAGLLQPLARRRDPGGRGGEGDRRERAVLPGRGLLPRHRQDPEAGVLHREPARWTRTIAWPSMSALTISAHVKDGIRMAREARLPEQIDIILQHHGCD